MDTRPVIQTYSTDVLVCGGGVAGLTTAIAAHQAGARVLLIEKAAKDRRGGNTRFSDGQIRYPHPADEYCEKGQTHEEFRSDLMRLSGGMADPDLIEVMVTQASPTVDWLTELGIQWDKGFPFISKYRRRPIGGGEYLVDTLHTYLERNEVPVWYESWVRELITDAQGRVVGAVIQTQEGKVEVTALGGVVMCTGGFQANMAMRAQYIGANAEHLLLRGSRYNTGEGLRQMMDVGAMPAGNWSDYHSAVLDARSPYWEAGNTAIYFYHLGIMVNRDGQRYLDEGEDYRDHTYVKFSKATLREPGGVGYSIVDDKVNEYPEVWARGNRSPFPSIQADSLEELASLLEIRAEGLLQTVQDFNAAIDRSVPFNPLALDGRRTKGLALNKSNWALPIDRSPYIAYPITGGITFTFGGVKVTPRAEVVNVRGDVIPGLYTSGEPIGGIFWHNYPGATSVLRGAVFGRIAGEGAARRRSEP